VSDGRAFHRLAALPLFAGLDERELSLLVDTVVTREQVSKGALLYLQGEYSRAYYVLDRGAARLLRVDADGAERVIRELKPGEAVGEGALWVGESRDVTLEATEEATFFAIEAAAFAAFRAEQPAISARLAPRDEVLRQQDQPRLRWQRAGEILLAQSRVSGWALTTRRLVHQDVLGRREVPLRHVRDVRARRAFLLGRWLDVGRVEVLAAGGRRMVWRGVRQPERLANLMFTEVGRDRARAQAEARARARRALDPESANLPPEPPRPQPDPLLSGEIDWLAVGLWGVAEWLGERLSPAREEETSLVEEETNEPPPRSSRESPL